MPTTNIQSPPKYPILGLNMSATSYNAVIDQCAQWITEFRRADSKLPARYICVTSVHGVMMAQRDSELREIINRADIATPDGMPLVWALRSFGKKGQERVYGPDLMLAVCEQASELGHRVFFYGSRPEVLEQLTRNLRSKYPALEIIGSYSPPFRSLTPEEEAGIQEQVIESDCDIVFVGISTPKQERWMADHLQALPGVVMVGVGAAFDFHAGRVKQAPKWMQNSGLEWLFRLSREPARLWKRYILVTPWFIPCWGAQWLRSLRANDDTGSLGSQLEKHAEARP